jgi:phage portal protein BeeE
VLGDSLTFTSLMMTATDAQFLEQMKFGGVSIAACFGVPAYMVNLEVYPRSIAVEALTQMYYGQCLQVHIEAIELGLNDGLALPSQYAVKFDLDGLLRMDQASQIKALVEGIGGGLFSPNEGRGKVNLPPVEGGETPYLQQQNYSLGALARRDSAQADPFAPATPPDAPPASGTEPAPADAAAAGKWWSEVFDHVDELGFAA